ncbi:MAG TPA: class I SAM-dependent methyltransferase, partial [Actinomycetes bacterium]|nr:class I SAM-dependent methyltransferase [Actinomycetes bacterium]
VADGSQVLDVGCGFGGALDYIRTHRSGCRLAGINIDERQVQEARRLLGGPEDIAFTVADGCRLPVADRSVDHVLAVECLFHFPSRKKFFREAARVLRPGGTLALSDFLFNRGTLSTITPDLFVTDDQAAWYGRQSRPLTSDGYGRLGRGTGFDVLVDDDVSEGTFPTYAALRRLYRERELPDGVRAIDGLANLASAGVLGYHVLAFRRRG